MDRWGSGVNIFSGLNVRNMFLSEFKQMSEKEQTEETCIKAIKLNPYLIYDVKKKTHYLCMYAISKNCLCLSLIENFTLLMAIQAFRVFSNESFRINKKGKKIKIDSYCGVLMTSSNWYRLNTESSQNVDWKLNELRKHKFKDEYLRLCILDEYGPALKCFEELQDNTKAVVRAVKERKCSLKYASERLQKYTPRQLFELIDEYSYYYYLPSKCNKAHNIYFMFN